NSVNRLFYKYHTPKEGTIISALKACTRLISLNNKNDTTQLVPINRIEGDLSKYWIETPECPSYTVSEVLEVASYIFESLDPSRKTIPICNAYIRVFGSAKRIDLAFAFFNQMRRSNSRRPNVYTYKALISCCVDALDLESAYAVIEDSTKLVLQDAKDTSNWFYHARNLGLGMIVAKCLAISYLIISRDLDLLEPLGGIEIDKIAIAGIGIGTILCARVAMLRLFEPQMETPRQTHDLYSASISHNEFLKMSSQEIRNYMYSYLIFRLLFKSHFNEALVV
ncbi:5965_t:CDS:1, partial [Acaulospora morrowiae]